LTLQSRGWVGEGKHQNIGTVEGIKSLIGIVTYHDK
jgi:hypothetical protein